MAHGINTETYFPETNKNNGNELCVAMFGRVRKQKGSHLFVRACIAAFPQHPNASAKIIGAITSENSDFVASLKQEIADAGLSDRIQFLGEHDFENIPGLFRQSDIVAALSSTEGFGLTILEAMASGAAVLATEAGAWPEIIEQGVHGWVVPVNDQDAITAKLDLLLQNPAKLKEMGKAGRDRVLSHYRIEEEAKKLCAIYQEMQTQL